MTTGSFPRISRQADIVLLGVSRTSKTPTSIYLANRGIKTANIPLVPGMSAAAQASSDAQAPLVVGLVATPERIVQIRAKPAARAQRDRMTRLCRPRRGRRGDRRLRASSARAMAGR